MIAADDYQRQTCIYLVLTIIPFYPLVEIKEVTAMSTATEVINVRIPAAQKALIDSAAQLLGKRMSGMFFDFKRCGNLVP